jgi:ketosteroid isomerase-like protein
MRAFRKTGTSGILLAGLIMAVAGCGGQAPEGRATNSRAADEEAIRALVVQTVEAAGRKDMETYRKFYAHDALLVLPGMPITKHSTVPMRGFPEGYAIKMDTVKVGISELGDMGYAFGTYEQTAPDKSGALADTVGKWMGVFQKQPDGAWGAVADTYNVDPPP